MTAAPMPTPSGAAFWVAFAIADMALLAVFARIIRWAWRGSNRDAARDIDQAVALVCQPCNGYSRTAPCTCPGKCTAAVCMAPAVRRG
jgi:hypothetical protein